jgi:CheY-like chemotaxis protein
MTKNQTRVLFVDDDPTFLDLFQRLISELAGPDWVVFTAQDSAQALNLLHNQTIDLLVTDIHMPVVDGLQFLKILQRQYPNLLKVVLTADSSGAYRASCLSHGAELFLEKPRHPRGWQTIFAHLQQLVRMRPEAGFQGVLRKVGLQDIIQLECLARNSSLLEVTTGGLKGEIFIRDGQLIHARLGDQTGEEALNQLLALPGGEFRLKPYAEPPAETVTGSWEFLLMEGARQRDESAAAVPAGTAPEVELVVEPPPPPPVAAEPTPPADVLQAMLAVDEGPMGSAQPQTSELLVCSLQGSVLHEWQCVNTGARVDFLEFLSQKTRHMGQGLALGGFDRLEARSNAGRLVVRFAADHALFLRCIPAGSTPAPNP